LCLVFAFRQDTASFGKPGQEKIFSDRTQSPVRYPFAEVCTQPKILGANAFLCVAKRSEAGSAVWALRENPMADDHNHGPAAVSFSRL
jgi:hypothetical protein